MEKHITVLGAIYIIFNGLAVGTATLMLLTVYTGKTIIPGLWPSIEMGTIGVMIAVAMLVLSVPGVIGGIALLKRTSWARIFVLALGCLNLLNFPLGIILGIYTLWVLTRPEVQNVLSRRSDFK